MLIVGLMNITALDGMVGTIAVNRLAGGYIWQWRSLGKELQAVRYCILNKLKLSQLHEEDVIIGLQT